MYVVLLLYFFILQNLDVNTAVNNLLSRDEDDPHNEDETAQFPSGGKPTPISLVVFANKFFAVTKSVFLFVNDRENSCTCKCIYIICERLEKLYLHVWMSLWICVHAHVHVLLSVNEQFLLLCMHMYALCTCAYTVEKTVFMYSLTEYTRPFWINW